MNAAATLPQAPQPRTRMIIQDAKERAAANATTPAHELSRMAMKADGPADRVLVSMATEWYAEDLEKENARLRDQLTDLQREITGRVAHSKGCREIARERGLIEEHVQ